MCASQSGGSNSLGSVPSLRSVVNLQVAKSDAFDDGLLPGLEPSPQSCRQVTAWQVIARRTCAFMGASLASD